MHLVTFLMNLSLQALLRCIMARPPPKFNFLAGYVNDLGAVWRAAHGSWRDLSNAFVAAYSEMWLRTHSLLQGIEVMGFDLYGDNETYFRATVWEWPLIASVIEASGALAITEGEQDLGMLWTNDGYFVNRACAASIADWLETMLNKDARDRFVLPSSVHVDKTGRLVAPDTDTESILRVDQESLGEFVRFCRTCGTGFEIW